MKTTRNLILTLLLALPLMGGAFSGIAGTSGISGISAADSSVTNPIHMGTVIDEVIWVVGDEAII